MKKEKKEVIKFIELADEISREENKDFVDYHNEENIVYKETLISNRNSYIKALRRKFSDILRIKLKELVEFVEVGSTGDEVEEKIDEVINEKYRNDKGHYIIPIEEKDLIKTWIKEYTSSPIKKIRDGKADEVTIEEDLRLLEKMKENIEINEKIDKEKRIKDINELNKYYGKKTTVETIASINGMVEKVLKDTILDKDAIRELNDRDYQILILLYKEMIISTQERWKNILSECKIYRENEFFDNIEEYVDNGKELEDYKIGLDSLVNPLDMVVEVLEDEYKKKYMEKVGLELVTNMKRKYLKEFKL